MSNGKGSKSRPKSVSRKEFESNWDAVFGKKRVSYSDLRAEDIFKIEAITPSEFASVIEAFSGSTKEDK